MSAPPYFLEKKNCPFCGESDDGQHLDEVAPGTWATVCQGCGAIGPHDPEEKQTATLASFRWLRRK
jgi:ribosome-binding protein aMBF1 (putative translation factor)